MDEMLIVGRVVGWQP